MVTTVVVFSILFLTLNKREKRVLPITPLEGQFVRNSNVLGTESVGQIVFYDSNGVRLGTSLNENFKPQIDISVDDKSASKTLPPLVNTTKTVGIINTFLINGWTKFIDLISVILDKIIS